MTITTQPASTYAPQRGGPVHNRRHTIAVILAGIVAALISVASLIMMIDGPEHLIIIMIVISSVIAAIAGMVEITDAVRIHRR